MAPYAFPAPGAADARRPRRPRLRAAIALGASLAPRGTMVKIALALMAVTTLGSCATAAVLSGRGEADALVELGAATSTALAWGAGVLVAVPAASRALREDRKNGIRALLLARGASVGTYARGRVVGLALVLMGVVGGGALLGGGAAFLLASRAGVAARAFEGLLASLVYAAAFAIVVAPLALATLGAASRAGGYLRFLAVIVGPELIAGWTAPLVPPGWREILSVPPPSAPCGRRSPGPARPGPARPRRLRPRGGRRPRLRHRPRGDRRARSRPPGRGRRGAPLIDSKGENAGGLSARQLSDSKGENAGVLSARPLIVLEGVIARVPPLALAPLTARFEAGVHALLGGRADGPSVVLGVIAGSVRVRGGRAQVLGSPAGDAHVRRSVAHVPLDVALLPSLRVDEVLAVAARVRGEPARAAASRLSPFGLGPLAERRISSLSREEARAVAFAEALTSTATLLLLEEPFASVDPRALGHLLDAIRARARDGACILVATGSTRDARALGDDVLTFSRGALVRRAPATDALVLAGPRGASVRVVASDPKRLAIALAGEPAVRTVAIEEGILVLGAEDVVSVAAAVARTALREDVALEMIRPELLRDDELRAAIAGDAAGAYRAAYERALGPAPVARPRGPEDVG